MCTAQSVSHCNCSDLMGKHTNILHGPALNLVLVLLLMCFAIHAQSHVIDDKSSEKINFPHGLCVNRYQRIFDCPKGLFYLCLANGRCYVDVDSCVADCENTYSGATATPTHPRLPFSCQF
ncbi:unnamed protein product [Alopecurus aequalis]